MRDCLETTPEPKKIFAFRPTDDVDAALAGRLELVQEGDVWRVKSAVAHANSGKLQVLSSGSWR